MLPFRDRLSPCKGIETQVVLLLAFLAFDRLSPSKGIETNSALLKYFVIIDAPSPSRALPRIPIIVYIGEVEL